MKKTIANNQHQPIPEKGIGFYNEYINKKYFMENLERNPYNERVIKKRRNEMMETAYRDRINKTFGQGDNIVYALSDVNLSVEKVNFWQLWGQW